VSNLDDKKTCLPMFESYLRNSMRRLTNRFKPENPEPTEDSKPTNTEKVHPERNIEKKR